MRKGKKDDLRPEYLRDTLGQGIRGKHLKSYRAGTNLVLLNPDVAQVFPTEESVNDALRSLIQIAKRSITSTKESGQHAKTDEKSK